MRRKIKSTIYIILSFLLILYSQASFALAQTVPTAPTAPIAPTTTSQSVTAPSQPVAPTPPPEPTPSVAVPTPPTAPTVESVLNPTPTPTPKPKTAKTTSGSEFGGDSGSQGSTGTTGSSGSAATSTASGTNGTGGQADSGNNGNTAINTGDATSTAGVSTAANSNTSLVGTGSSSPGIKVLNDSNGASSNNSGSVKLSDATNSVQDNTATVVNNLGQQSNTGKNEASKNLGDSKIVTGDANTTGTILTAVNTNIAGVTVSEFNVVDDHIGDIILDFSAGCVSGCSSGDVKVANVGNGANSNNNGQVGIDSVNNSFQNNDATLENNLVLKSNSGDNEAEKNTGGDSTIVTGDANVSANVLNFVNNNVAGGVYYAVVNIFGNLVGDIIFPNGAVLPCCGGNTSVSNAGNGAGSTNSASSDQTISNNLVQFNNADIENNLIFDATTGNNDTSKNTGGSSSITTGDANILAQAINIANNNIAGGDWWLVIVNEAGKWIGKILGAPDGANLAGSEGFEFIVDENGEVIATNSGNGVGSTNSTNVNQNVQNNVVQTNNAKVVNNVNLSANTGGNSASMNTNGDSSIKTGDANIIANIVNFVNNNIVGDGRLFVTVINVFGSWLGDFISPGQTKTSSNGNSESQGHGGAVGGASFSDGTSSSDGSLSSGSQLDTSGGTHELVVQSSSLSLSLGVKSLSSKIKGNLGAGSSAGESLALSESAPAIPEIAGKKVVKLNLAWGLIIVVPFVFSRIKKRLVAALLKNQ